MAKQNRYRIRVTKTFDTALTIEAENVETAKEKAKKIVSDGFYTWDGSTIEAEDISDHCKDCKFAQAWQCGAKVFHYCEKRKTKHAVNGLRKVRLKDTACPLFEPKENPKAK